MKLEIVSDSRDSAILIGDEDHNDIAEFFHNEHATVSQSYETALMLAKKLVGEPACSTCNDTGEIDERLGGSPLSNRPVRCPDCPDVPAGVVLNDIVCMNESAPYYHEWRGVKLRVVSLRVDPVGKQWVSVIEGDQRHRGNGVYDGETTDIDASYLSAFPRPERCTPISSAPGASIPARWPRE